MDRKEMIARILQAKADKVYFLYDTFMLKDLEEMDEKQLIEIYANMQNYLSDKRTSSEW